MIEKVTTFYLEMNDIKEFKPKNGFKEILEIKPISRDVFQHWMMFVGVGSPWRWYSRLKWTVEEWEHYLKNTDTHSFLAFSKEHLVGYFELVRSISDIEIKFFGLFPAYIGSGYGGALLSHAIEIAWNMDAEKVWLHTCTADHKDALANYVARGFKIVNQTEDMENIPGREEYIGLANQFINQYITKISGAWSRYSE